MGPVFGLPMTSDPLLGGGQWLIGPTAVGLYQCGGWTMGALVNQQFSIADTGNRDLPYFSQAFIQPFFAYTNKHAVTFTLQSQSTYNWEGDPGPALDGARQLPRQQADEARPLPVQRPGGRRLLRGEARRRAGLAIAARVHPPASTPRSEPGAPTGRRLFRMIRGVPNRRSLLAGLLAAMLGSASRRAASAPPLSGAAAHRRLRLPLPAPPGDVRRRRHLPELPRRGVRALEGLAPRPRHAGSDGGDRPRRLRRTRRSSTSA